MVDHEGQIVDGDEILYVIARDRHRRAIDFGGVVGTKMTNLGLELALQDMQIPFVRADVGDRYVLAEMLTRRWSLGGESSGHIICHDINTTGDGIISALQAMEAVVHSGKTLAEIKGEMRKLPQTMVNVRLPSKQDITGNERILSAVAEAETKLGKSGRVLLRPSGTEPVIRVMVEGEDRVMVDKLARELSELVARVVS
jgi:phosphoglucosamine mutase